MFVLQLFERNVFAAPDAVAIAFEGRRITYRELNSTADRIAEGLREAGIATGSLVGVLLDRSPEMVAGLLGIWKAGGVYIPLDSAAPVERIAFMVEDAAPSFVLTHRRLFSEVPGTAGARSERPLRRPRSIAPQREARFPKIASLM